ncbi:matrixin family metalloprotease [Saccharothrix syringae]|uniref:Matrixin family metalloprotease n=1 Tax=Saccharothrix syringae TaxID=103733 RepID=A0A5Q0HAQ4_SACSY|nr:matrixin family metalloprotease [Saccharothrix syringae]QFZ23328.1 matrixin family metalloprotease [Saccharothrix syringae]
MSTIRGARRAAAVTALVAVTAMLLGPATANAHFLGGSFPHTPGNWLYIGYTVSGSYQPQQHAAASSWHSTPTRVWVTQEDFSVSEEDYYGYAYNTTWWGLTTMHPCFGSGCVYRWADLQLNTNTLGSETDFIRQKVAAHEFGHGLGLAHATDGTYNSIMRQGYLSYNTPQTHDIDDINSLYPY